LIFQQALWRVSFPLVYIPECCMFQEEGLAPSVEPGGQIYICDGDHGESWSLIDLRHVDFGIFFVKQTKSY